MPQRITHSEPACRRAPARAGPLRPAPQRHYIAVQYRICQQHSDGGGGAGWDVADLRFEPSILSPSFRPEPAVGATEWPPITRQCLLSVGEFVVSLGLPRSNSILHKLLMPFLRDG